MAINCYKKLVYDSRPTQTNSFIIIHNAAGGPARAVYDTFIENKTNGKGTMTHYAVDHNTIIKMLEDNWNAQHTTGKGFYPSWGRKAEGVGNSNSIGIEVADGPTVDMMGAIENCIELTRHLMKTYNIPISNIVRHGDTQNKGCPATIMTNKKWDYMLGEIKKRNDANKPINFDTSALNKSDMTADESIDNNNNIGDGASITVQIVFANDGYTTVQESLPNANTSDNWVDMHKIKGMTLHMYPPYQMVCEVADMEKMFEDAKWDRNFHYKVDYKTKVDYSQKVPLSSGIGRGGNDIGSSLPDFVLVPGEGVHSGGSIDIGGGSGSGSGDGTLTGGNSVAEICWDYFVSVGCSNACTAGIIGNIDVESGGFNVNAESSDGHFSIGLFQWTGSRKDAFINAAEAAGNKKSDPKFQCEYAWKEMIGEIGGSYNLDLLNRKYGGLTKFKTTTDIDYATEAWCWSFERPAGNGLIDRRKKSAKKHYDLFANKASGGGGTVSGVFGWPIPGVTSIPNRGYFGDPRGGGSRKHSGVDVSCAQATSIKSYASGTVEVASYGNNSGRGNYVKLSHGSGTYSLYAHIMPNGIKVKVGDKVSGGQEIAKVGNTGNSTGPHLHFEIWKNGAPVNPLDWVKIGGGAKNNGKSISVFNNKDLEKNPTTYDNIDRTRILFAGVDNRQHTYIDRALFNNQHPKYTVSIGAFFNDERSEPEKSSNITDSDKGWPRTERNLIKQTAQSLFFEGFTSKQLWREFDLTRAPSPFLYLDREKWKGFLKEVDKQVDWLVKKYGQVSSTYVPYNLLENMNTNQFIEMSPDLGLDPDIIKIALGGGNTIGGGIGNGETTKLTALDGGFWIGDDVLASLEKQDLIPKEIDAKTKYSICGNYFYGTAQGQLIDKTKDFPASPKYIYVQFGSMLNTTKPVESYIASNQPLLDKIVKMYPNIPIFVGRTIPPCKKYTFGNLKKTLEYYKKYNEVFSQYCNSKGLYFLNNIASSPTNFLDGEYLDCKYDEDQYHFYISNKYSSDLFENIKSSILNTEIIIKTTDDGNTDGGGDGGDGGESPEQTYKNTYGYVKNLCKFYKKVDGKYRTALTGNKYEEVKLLTGLIEGEYYYISYKGTKYYVKANNITRIKKNTYGYTYKKYIGHEMNIWPSTALYNKASITSGTKKVFNASFYGKILDADINFYKVEVEGEKGWVKAYRVNISDAVKTKELKSESPVLQRTIAPYSVADPSKKGFIAYVENDSTILLDKASTDGNEIGTYFKGEEFEITGANSNYYQVKNIINQKATGYLKAIDLIVLTVDKYGKTDKSNINKVAYIKYDNTLIYEASNTNIAMPITLDTLDECLILDVGKGFYKVKLVTDSDKDNQVTRTGWIKAYRLTTDKSYFDFEKENSVSKIGNISIVELTNSDFEYAAELEREWILQQRENNGGGETNPDETKKNTRSIYDSGFEVTEEMLKYGWEVEGKPTFDVFENGKFGEKGRFSYRGDYLARIKNDNKSLSGIKQDITVCSIKELESNNTEDNETETLSPDYETVPHKDDNDFAIRVSTYLKQVTSSDVDDGVSENDVKELLDGGITYYLLDKNNNEIASAKIPLPQDTKKFGKRTALFMKVKPGKYTFMVGSKNKYDVYIDNILIEQIYDYNKEIEDFNSSGNIGSSGVGNTSFDNGGIMIYSQEKPVGGVDSSPPKIETIITQEEYEDIIQNAERFLIENYTNSFEPYDKGLEEILNAGIMTDDRLNTLTESMNSFTGNMIRYCVVEAGPGSTDHCVKPADELNILYKQVEVNSEPIYPDLIIPPNYITSENDVNSDSSIPLEAMQNGTLKDKDVLNKQFSFDYKTLENKEKKSKGKIINYNDPYPYDDKIAELEQHYPKVKIDELESRLYSCNHPGCPVAHPMAKNFAMLSDSAIAQSKRTEQRLARIENVLSTIIRNVGRIGSRMHINCCYYGGQDIYNKYKNIRCLHDDRLHDGASVTLDQCLCCTRYEPIIGQVYEILDETGFNGSAILDDMQMSYMELEDFKNLNRIEKRSSTFNYSNVNREEKNIPMSLTEIWNKEDLKTYKDKLIKDITDKDELKKLTANIQASDYSFVMNWAETEIDTQAPDVKPYPNEGLKTKYYIPQEKSDTQIVDSSLDKELDKDTIKNMNNIESITKGEWVDTRKEANTIQSNKYTSEDFYFDNFNLNRTGYEYDNGLKGNVGINISGGGTIGGNGGDVSGSVSGSGSECRSKIVEYAKKVHEWHKEGKAQYAHSHQNYDPDKLKTYPGTIGGMKNPYAFDCSSLSSTCYKYAGLSSMYTKVCSGGTIMSEIVNNGGEMWLSNEAGITKALPGDCIVVCKGNHIPTQSDMDSKKKLGIRHIMIYIGDRKVIHASDTLPAPRGN